MKVEGAMNYFVTALRNIKGRFRTAVFSGVLFFVITVALVFCTLMLSICDVIAARNEDPYSDYYRLVVDKTALGEDFGYSSVDLMSSGGWKRNRNILRYFKDIEDYSGIIMMNSTSVELDPIMPDNVESKVINKDFKLFGVMRCIDLYLFGRGDLVLSEGRLISRDDHDNKEKVCVISRTLASLNGIGVGDTFDIGLYNERFTPDAKPVAFTVVGLFEDTVWRDKKANMTSKLTENYVLLPFSALEVTDYGLDAYNFQIKADDRHIKEIERLTNYYSASFTDGYESKFIKVSDIYAGQNHGLRMLESTVRLLQYMLIGILCVLLVIFVYTSLNHRRREMGIYLALGGTKLGSVFMTFFEASIPVAIGTILGGDFVNLFMKRPAIALAELVLGQRSADSLSNTTSDSIASLSEDVRIIESALSHEVMTDVVIKGAGTVIIVFAISSVLTSLFIVLIKPIKLLSKAGD